MRNATLLAKLLTGLLKPLALLAELQKVLTLPAALSEGLGYAFLVMTTCDYDLDANFFAYYFPITTPPSPACTITRNCSHFRPTLCTSTSASPTQLGP